MDEDVDRLLCVSFNQDAKSLEVGHSGGYHIYDTTRLLNNQESILCNKDDSGKLRNAIIVERLFSSALVVVVSRDEPRAMHVYHFTTRSMICDHKYNKSILSVKINRERVVVCLEDSIFVYNLKDMKLLHSIVDTPLNRLGLLDLCSSDNSHIAYPGKAETGNVNVFDGQHLTALHNFGAHDGPLAAIKFNSDGTLLATASTKGTVIRVFGLPQCTKLFEFRRGMSRCVTIHSLAFSSNSAFLCSSSNTETVHVFKLETAQEQEKQEAVADGSWYGYFSSAAASVLPTQVNELMTVERSFATAHLPGMEKKSIAAMLTQEDKNHLLVATTDGFLYCYEIEPEGGECNLIKQCRIGPKGDTVPAAPAANESSVPVLDDPSDFPPIAPST